MSENFGDLYPWLDVWTVWICGHIGEVSDYAFG